MLTARLVRLGPLFALLCCIPAAGQEDRKVAPTEQLYLLAGTPSFFGYPVTLYRPESGKLKAVREVIPESEGLQSAKAWDGVIFLVHPARGADTESTGPDSRNTRVTILHTGNPLLADDVSIDSGPGDFFIDPGHIAVTEPRSSVFDELLPSFKGGLVAGNLKILDVSSALSAARPRVRFGSVQEYSALRLEGDSGGPVPSERFFVTVSDEHLVLTEFDAPPLVIDSVPSAVQAAAKETGRQRLDILAASQGYLLLKRDYGPDDWAPDKLGNSTEVFIHDRVRNQWKTIQVEGNLSRSRLFGSWLASIVAMYGSKPSPGEENERSTGGAGGRGQGQTAPLPNVWSEFRTAWAGAWLPGVLTLQNIEDGRKIRIETNQADSEILSVRGDTVLYRVNDTIYQTRIVNDKVQDSAVLAKDEDVPEIHWGFWSPQTEVKSR
jgi:hypothetical protein